MELNPQNVTFHCDKCGRRLPTPGYGPTLCPRCELVELLNAERYGPRPDHERPGHARGEA